MIKKILIAVGAVVVAVVVAAVALVILANRQMTSVADEATPYADSAVQAITGNWNPDELVDRMAPELRAVADPEDVEAIFDAASAALGSRVEYLGSELVDTRSETTVAGGSKTVARFLAEARFVKGNASFEVLLLKTDDGWAILNFRINSSEVLQGIAGPKT